MRSLETGCWSKSDLNKGGQEKGGGQAYFNSESLGHQFGRVLVSAL